jgi:hypothetical protein
MATIWKFPLVVEDEQVVSMPTGAVVLTVQAQHDLYPCLWAKVNPTAAPADRRFRTYGTGHAMKVDGQRYVGTYQLYGGDFVGHVFEVTA